MKRLFLSFVLVLIFVFVFSFSFLKPFDVNANEVNDTYNFEYSFDVDNSSYYMQLRQDVIYETNNLIYLSSLPSRSLIGLNIVVDGVFYNQLIFNTNSIERNVEIFLYSTVDDSFLILLSVYDATYYSFYNERFSMYNGVSYNFTMFEGLNICFNFTNDIEQGYFTFNQSLIGLDFSNYSFVSSSTDYKINGTLVYLNNDGFYLFDLITLNPTQRYFNLSMFDINNDNSSYDILNNFTNDTDFLRYWYLDSQTIDTVLYEYLSNNGVFQFSYGGLDRNASFWELINAYVNIPNTIIGGMLGFSIFKGTTILVIFATITIIVLAIKVIKMVNWS